MMGTPRLLLDDGYLIDGTGAPPVRHGAVLISDEGTIMWAGRSADAPELSPGTRRVDVQGAALLPGFTDTHVHVLSPGGGGTNPLVNATHPASFHVLRAASNLRATLHAGVTTIRDLAGADLGVKQAIEAGLVEGPRIRIAIGLIGPTGGHGDSTFPSGLSLNGVSRISAVADGEDECRKVTRALIRAGADWIKVASSGGVWSPTSQPDHEGLSENEIRVVVDVARRHGNRRVAAHAQGRDGIANAVRAGVASIEHGYQIDQRTIDDMLARGTYLVPTLTTVTREPDPAKTLPVNYEKKMRWIKIARQHLPAAIQAGVKVALGTDCGVADHGDNLTELTRLVEFGMTPMQAILAGTRNAAKLLGMSDEIGSLEPGKRADVVIADGDPLTDITILANPDRVIMVVKDGQVCKDTRGLMTAPGELAAVAARRLKEEGHPMSDGFFTSAVPDNYQPPRPRPADLRARGPDRLPGR
jgi:imidazolonepropionase-like amidohydrolase